MDSSLTLSVCLISEHPSVSILLWSCVNCTSQWGAAFSSPLKRHMAMSTQPVAQRTCSLQKLWQHRPDKKLTRQKGRQCDTEPQLLRSITHRELQGISAAMPLSAELYTHKSSSTNIWHCSLLP